VNQQDEFASGKDARDIHEETDVDLQRVLTRAELLGLHKNLAAEAFELMQRKNADYASGDDALQNFRTCSLLGIADADAGILVRITDKLQRLANLRTREAAVLDESEIDTAKDVINYIVLYLACRGLRHD
jgi:hypothetical protein